MGVLNNTLPIITLIAGLIIGASLFKGCDRFEDYSGEVVKSDTIYITDTFTLIEPKFRTVRTFDTVPEYFTVTEYKTAYDTLFYAYHDTNIYNIDTMGVSAELRISENKLNFARFAVTHKEITNTVVKKRFQVLIAGGVSYPFGAYVGAGFRTKKDLAVIYQYHTTGLHSIGVVSPLRFR